MPCEDVHAACCDKILRRTDALLPPGKAQPAAVPTGYDIAAVLQQAVKKRRCGIQVGPAWRGDKQFDHFIDKGIADTGVVARTPGFRRNACPEAALFVAGI